MNQELLNQFRNVQNHVYFRFNFDSFRLHQKNNIENRRFRQRIRERFITIRKRRIVTFCDFLLEETHDSRN